MVPGKLYSGVVHACTTVEIMDMQMQMQMLGNVYADGHICGTINPA